MLIWCDWCHDRQQCSGQTAWCQHHDSRADGSSSTSVCVLVASGVEGGSGRVAGRQLMDLWDALCTLLAARQVSVEDVSNKVRG
jgi:hypothetical protein